jgi:hypothetical protein
VGSAIQKEDDLVRLNCQVYPDLLSLDTKNWNLERRLRDPPFKGAIWPLLQVEMGTV